MLENIVIEAISKITKKTQNFIYRQGPIRNQQDKMQSKSNFKNAFRPIFSRNVGSLARGVYFKRKFSFLIFIKLK